MKAWMSDVAASDVSESPAVDAAESSKHIVAIMGTAVKSILILRQTALRAVISNF